MSAPVNDNLADAILLSGYSDSAVGTTVDSTMEVDEITYGWDHGDDGDVWYYWVAPADGNLELNIDATFSGQMVIGTGTDFSDMIVVDYGAFPGPFIVPVTNGETYKIQITYFATPGTFDLDLTFSEPLPIFTITSTSGSGGAIDPLGEIEVTQGDSQLFTITPDYGYEVSQVLVDDISVDLVDGTYTFDNVIIDHTISVTFDAIPIVVIPVDCGILGLAVTEVDGLDHLEGQTVSILADGEVLDPQVVSGGKVTFEDYYSKVIVGLPYESDLETLNVELNDPEDTMQGKKIKIGNVIFRVIATRGGFIGPNEDVLYDAFNKAIIDKIGSEDLSLSYTGDLRMPLGSSYEDGGRVFYKQKQPLPVTIGMIVPEANVGGPAG